MISTIEEALVTGGPDAFQSREERRRELARDVVAAAYVRGDFMLSSGEATSYYFDKYLFETKPTILRRLASLLAPAVPGDTDRLAGPELGAVPLTVALSLETGLPFVIVRQDHPGSTRLIEGELHPEERILLVEDVLFSGRRALQAAERIRQAGGNVIGVTAVVDRLQGAAAALATAGLPLDALLTVDDLLVGDHAHEKHAREKED